MPDHIRQFFERLDREDRHGRYKLIDRGQTPPSRYVSGYTLVGEPIQPSR